MAQKTVGLIKPTERPGSRTVEDLLRILPEGVLVKQTHLNIRRGTRAELEQALIDYEEKIAEMARAGVDLIHPAGVPPLLLGYEGERELVCGWETKYGKPIFTNGMSQVNALRAFRARRIIGISYFSKPLNEDFSRYLSQAGFDVLEMEGMPVAFEDVISTPVDDIRTYIRAMFHRHEAIDAIYLVGSAWRTLDILEAMESEFGVPIIHHVPAQCWEIQRRLGLRIPVPGYGRLIGEMRR